MKPSPDLNQLENLFESRLENCRSQTLSIQSEWANISVSLCASLVEIYPKRLAAVIAAKGGSTKC